MEHLQEYELIFSSMHTHHSVATMSMPLFLEVLLHESAHEHVCTVSIKHAGGRDLCASVCIYVCLSVSAEYSFEACWQAGEPERLLVGSSVLQCVRLSICECVFSLVCQCVCMFLVDMLTVP